MLVDNGYIIVMHSYLEAVHSQ